MRRVLPPRVYLKDGSYWHVASIGKVRVSAAAAKPT